MTCDKHHRSNSFPRSRLDRDRQAPVAGNVGHGAEGVEGLGSADGPWNAVHGCRTQTLKPSIRTVH